MLREIDTVLEKLEWMEAEEIWPNGQRYLWTDAFGVVLLASLYQTLEDEAYLDEAERVVDEVERVLGRPRGVRIGEAPGRDGQYFHYLAMWVYALGQLGRFRPQYRDRAIELVQEIHPRFVRPGVGVLWKMKEDLSGIYPGFGYGAIDAYQGYVVYRTLAPDVLEDEIAEMKELVEQGYRALHVDQDLGLGMMLWLTHFFPEEAWATLHRQRSLVMLDQMWIDSPGYFCRYPGQHQVKFAFTNYGASVGLQAVGEQEYRVERLNAFFADYRSGDRYDTDAITHVMAATSHFPGLLIREEVPEPA